MSPHAQLCGACGSLHPLGFACPARAERRRARERQRRRGVPRLYSTAAWQRAREACFRRDDYRCVDCSRHRSELEPHERLAASHEIRPEDDPALALDLENLRTRCTTCHNALDAERRRRR